MSTPQRGGDIYPDTGGPELKSFREGEGLNARAKTSVAAADARFVRWRAYCVAICLDSRQAAPSACWALNSRHVAEERRA